MGTGQPEHTQLHYELLWRIEAALEALCFVKSKWLFEQRSTVILDFITYKFEWIIKDQLQIIYILYCEWAENEKLCMINLLCNFFCFFCLPWLVFFRAVCFREHTVKSIIVSNGTKKMIFSYQRHPSPRFPAVPIFFKCERKLEAKYDKQTIK